LDIDGGTEIGAAVVDADLFIIDDGAGGTNRKCLASRIKTYAGGGNTPYFFASMDDGQTITNDTTTLVEFDVAVLDSASGYNTTNKAYTVPAAGVGYWQIGVSLGFSTGATAKLKAPYLYPRTASSNMINQNSFQQSAMSARMDEAPFRSLNLTRSFILAAAEDDVWTIYANLGHSDGGSNTGTVGAYESFFWGFKLAT